MTRENFFIYTILSALGGNRIRTTHPIYADIRPILKSGKKGATERLLLKLFPQIGKIYIKS
ncbi:MAG: hypothetical protein ACYTBX_15915, partial [Planctomycetota bacterium]